MLEARGAVGGESDSHSNSNDEQQPFVSGGTNLYVRSYGLRASLNSTYVDLIGGIDEHRIARQHIREEYLGLRERFITDNPCNVYIEAALRRGFDLETTSGTHDYDGMESGLGAIIQLSKHWFVDASFNYEWTFDRQHLTHSDDHLEGLLFNVGVGVSF